MKNKHGASWLKIQGAQIDDLQHLRALRLIR